MFCNKSRVILNVYKKTVDILFRFPQATDCLQLTAFNQSSHHMNYRPNYKLPGIKAGNVVQALG